jgi:vitamin B12 transporter
MSGCVLACRLRGRSRRIDPTNMSKHFSFSSSSSHSPPPHSPLAWFASQAATPSCRLIPSPTPSLIPSRFRRKASSAPSTLAAFAGLALAATALYSADSSASGVASDKLTVTATRTAVSATEVLANLSVISRQDIVDAGALSLLDLLQRRANLDIRSTGGPGQSSAIFLRGTSPTHTLLLVDGQRVGSSTSGAPAWEHLSLDMIDRIEIVRGPLSGLYGSDALGGVIQIFTRTPPSGSASTDLRAEATLGNYRAGQLGASLGLSQDRTSLSLSASHRRIDAPSASNPASGSFTYNPDRDAYKQDSASLKLSHELWQGERVTLSVWQSRGDVRFDAGLGNDARNQQTLSGMQIVSENKLTAFWRSKLSIGETSDDSKIRSAFPGRFETIQRQFSWQNEFVTPAGLAMLGIEQRRERVVATTNYVATNRTTDSVFGSISQRVGSQSLALNARHDREDQFGDRTTGGVTWGWQVSARERVYLAAGKAFRAPSFNDLYFPGFANPRLRPEQSESGEFGWRLSSLDKQRGIPEWTLNLAVFENRIDDLIAFDAATSRPQNIRRARIRGWELQLDSPWAGIDWRAQVTAQQPIDTDTGKQLRGRAKLFGTLAASVTNGPWRTGIDFAASGERFDSTNAAPSSRMAGYALLSGFVRYQLNREWELSLSGNNLLDKSYELAKGYNPLGRQLLLTARYQGR